MTVFWTFVALALIMLAVLLIHNEARSFWDQRRAWLALLLMGCAGSLIATVS